MNADVDTGGVIVPITDGEAILRSEKREISILVAREEVTITHARYSAGERVAGPHVHHEHTDAFYSPRGRTDLRDRARGRDDHVASACPSMSNGLTVSAHWPSSSCEPAFSERINTPSRSFTRGASFDTRLSPSKIGFTSSASYCL
jgi:hypothetical protein